MQPAEGEIRIFYRVTRSNPPTMRHFLSNTAKRRRPPDHDPETLRLWSGISVFDTERHARAKAHRVPAIGSFIAAVQIPSESQVHYEQTTGDRHHLITLWGDAGYLLQRVASVVPV